MLLEDKMKIITNLDESKGLPEPFIKNIFKLAEEQNKFSDEKWLKKMLVSSQKRFQSQLKLKEEKELKKLSEIKINQDKSLKVIKEKEEIKSKEYYINLLPRVENYSRKFRKIERVGIRYIRMNNGDWTLRFLGLLKDPGKIFSEWAVHFTTVLSHDFGIEKCFKMNFHLDPDLMHKTVTESQEFINRTCIRKEYRKWRKKEIKIQVKYFKEKYLKEMEKSNQEHCLNT